MSSIFKTFATLILLALPQAMFAQDSTAETPNATESQDQTSSAEPSDNGLSMGTSEVGSVYVAESFSDWQLRCVKTEEGKDPCQLYQLLKDDNGNAVSEISMFTVSGDGKAVGGATVITPLETLLTANLRMAVDTGASKVYPFAYCSRKGCHARLGFAEEDLDAFRKGAVATVAIVPAAAPDQRVNLTVSLAGFTAGWNALVAANAANAAARSE